MESPYCDDMTYSQVESSWLPFGTRFVWVFALAVILDFSDHHTWNRTCRIPLEFAVAFAAFAFAFAFAFAVAFAAFDVAFAVAIDVAIAADVRGNR